MKYFCFSIIFLIAACAPKTAPTPEYVTEDLSLQELVARAGEDIELIKAIADVTIMRNNEPYDFVKASVLAKKPGWVHMRIYKFGMLVRDFVVNDNDLFVLSGKNDPNLKKLGNEFYNAIFWWDRIEDGIMDRNGDDYVIRTARKKIRINGATLVPLHQEIASLDRLINITYQDPEQGEDGSWHPSLINIIVGDFTFTIKVKKLLKNPEISELDFRTGS